MEATRALDSPYSSHCFLDDCVALCWDVWKLSTKTSVEKIWGKYLDQKNSPTWREAKRYSRPGWSYLSQVQHEKSLSTG